MTSAQQTLIRNYKQMTIQNHPEFTQDDIDSAVAAFEKRLVEENIQSVEKGAPLVMPEANVKGSLTPKKIFLFAAIAAALVLVLKKG